ncbi:MAG: aldo/keto reductase [candidate division KSB1 bacterium]|nr:aldo/keto reductase [candidate division KSB1 bacterium]
MRTTDAAVLQRALDLGINYIDTAHSYQDGNNEVMVGNVMKNRRQDAYIATKVRSTSADEMRAMVETSLRRLQTDVIDVLQLHGLQTKEEVNNETAMEVLTRLKQEGKIRFMGFSTHRNQAEVIRAAVANRFYDVILVAYNFNSDNSVKEAIAEAAKVGIGIVAMKTQAGGYKTTKMGSLSPHQAALKWVLQDRNVATTIPSMVTFAQLEENIQVMGSKMGWQDWKTLDRYARSIDKLYCRICDSCAGTCPHGVAISDVNRCLMYAEGYGDLILAQQSYRDIPLSVNASQCRTCRTCMAKCVHGINIGQKMKLANQLFC